MQSAKKKKRKKLDTPRKLEPRIGCRGLPAKCPADSRSRGRPAGWQRGGGWAPVETRRRTADLPSDPGATAAGAGIRPPPAISPLDPSKQLGLGFGTV